MLTDFYRAATAIQHVCMAKALVREHDLQVMHMGPESDRHTRRMKVTSSRISVVLF